MIIPTSIRHLSRQKQNVDAKLPSSSSSSSIYIIRLLCVYIVRYENLDFAISFWWSYTSLQWVTVTVTLPVPFIGDKLS